MIDSHCHLADEAFEHDLEAVIARAEGAGLTGALMILAAGDEAEAARGRRVREMWPRVEVATGIHPHQAHEHASDSKGGVEIVGRALTDHRALALGEIGLDYHYDFSPRDVQREIFRDQVAMAVQRRLPVIIHTREATDDTFAILREVGAGRVEGVFHCFTGDAAMARSALELGFYLSFAGIVTFPRATELRDVAAFVPADRLLVETDAPYLAPVPNRGKRNEPAFVVRTAEALAELRGVPVAELAEQVTRNFEALFGAGRR